MSETNNKSGRHNFGVIIVGGGAAGLMCALTVGKSGKSVLVLERGKKPGAKILISGGGRCNFTNQNTVPEAYISQNSHFAKSALSRYLPQDFLGLISQHGATWHEKTLGQLFCDQGARKILELLLAECAAAGGVLKTGVEVADVSAENGKYNIKTNIGIFTTTNMVVASGGISIPKMGATGFAYDTARKFGLKIVGPQPALVPLIFAGALVEAMKSLAGIATDCRVSCGKASFREALLFTHRGLSGPAILQISSYWQQGDEIVINLLPDITSPLQWLKDARKDQPRAKLKTMLAKILPDRLADWLAASWPGNLADLSNGQLQDVAEQLGAWRITPTGTEGFAKAEVTRGGVSTEELSSKTMEAKNQPGLYFIGECVDVTGWLGGYNFQWAWASANACATNISVQTQ